MNENIIMEILADFSQNKGTDIRLTEQEISHCLRFLGCAEDLKADSACKKITLLLEDQNKILTKIIGKSGVQDRNEINGDEFKTGYIKFIAKKFINR